MSSTVAVAKKENILIFVSPPMFPTRSRTAPWIFCASRRTIASLFPLPKWNMKATASARAWKVIQFARKIGAHKLGIATCAGLLDESRTLAKILRTNGFEVYGAVCKMGANPKVSIGIPKECEAVGVNMCNPIMQALALNEAHTDLNLIMGLCVGHDSLFIKYSDALVTSVVTKDRVLGHNPCVALYQYDKYYKRLQEPQD